MKTETCMPLNLSIAHLLAVMVGLVVADGLISQAIMQYGLGHEGNPFLYGLTTPNSLLIKLAGSLLASIVLWDVHKTRPRPAEVAALLSVVLYTGIVFWNVGVFLLAR